jgi:nitrite reductase (NAD(P)H)
MTADRLQRTARWIENMEGGIEVSLLFNLACRIDHEQLRLFQKLRKVILQDELGICSELDAFMDNLINTYEDEWATVVKG